MRIIPYSGLLLLALLFSTHTVSGQQFLDHFVIPDSISKTKVEECVVVLNNFTAGRPDSLFAALGKDTSIVKLDTLKKYVHQYESRYKYSLTTAKNPTIWSTDSSEFYVERTYIGDAPVQKIEGVVIKSLVLRARMKEVNGRIAIVRIEFEIVPVTEEVRVNLLSRREKAQGKYIRENLPPPSFPK